MVQRSEYFWKNYGLIYKKLIRIADVRDIFTLKSASTFFIYFHKIFEMMIPGKFTLYVKHLHIIYIYLKT